MKLSASKFAEAAGLSVVTIGRYCRDGKISAERTLDKKGWLIDASELDRLNLKPPPKGEMLGSETPNSDGVLRREVELLREMLERERETVADLRERLDREAAERREAWARLEAPRHATPANDPPHPATPPETADAAPQTTHKGGWRKWLVGG